jgi:hypothetical protein
LPDDSADTADPGRRPADPALSAHEEARLLARVESRRDELVELTRALVRVPR